MYACMHVCLQETKAAKLAEEKKKELADAEKLIAEAKSAVEVSQKSLASF
jgi:hypothetical protein